MVLIEQGGVNADGENESNVYQLLVPTESRKKARVTDQSRTPRGSACEPPPGPQPNPRPGRLTTPDPVPLRTAAGVQAGRDGGPAAAPN